jgi:Bacterial toxin homologue of phage lysozyme, C-term
MAKLVSATKQNASAPQPSGQIPAQDLPSMEPPKLDLTASAQTPSKDSTQGQKPEKKKDALVLKPYEMTVLGEGADGATKFIEWPNTAASGVTLGKGYDIGSRSAKQVIEELTAAGMSKSQAEKISKGVGLKGQAAGNWVAANKKSVGEIALDVQYRLLDLVMPKFKAEAKSVGTNTKAEKDEKGNPTNAAGREKQDGVKAGTYVMSKDQWDGLHPAMVEFITDLKYQGGYYLYDRVEKINSALIKHHGNHLAQFKAVAALFEADKAGGMSYMDSYGKGIGEGTGNKELFYGQTKDQLAKASTRRNRIRLAFLKQIISAMEAGKKVEYGQRDPIAGATKPAKPAPKPQPPTPPKA